MANNTTVAAYDRLISAVRVFQKRNLEIEKQLLICSNNAVKAMNGDSSSKALEEFIKVITDKMSSIDSSANALKKNLEEVRDELLKIN